MRDSPTHVVDVFDRDPATGELSARRPFLHTGEAGVPDGLAVDTEGRVWVEEGAAARIGALVVVLALFGTLNDNFLSLANVQVIGEAATITGLLAIVQTVVIVYGRVNPTIATLAGLAACKGVAQLVSGGRAQGYVLNDPVFVFLGRGKIAGVPATIWILVVVAMSVHVLLTYTDIGRNLYAIGGNDTAARLAGININKYLVAVYALIGIVAAVAGVLLTARTGSGQPVSGSEGLELKAITAAALGGCALKGGKGGIGGTLLAVARLVAAVVIQQRRSGERAVGLPH
ncbi:SMP-30/gluconolactonase/LRE family protein [Streptomyces sp. G-G2]|uniref:ABC transporter permease subunit n=1 Tax=Streptomyces sp. G-G2 TaxID=3046201 RepID=UPI0024B8D5ED|nr:SMP-30/gluconolactonase/LRE family protein [Streptomyces sp. G-G2]MDJ0381784.1 SMP-30/gluconolactonase/LRE family protein [Streptomyces sp. G-G2]